MLGGQVLVDVHAEAGLLAGVQVAGLEAVAVREHGVGLLGVAHVLLQAEVGGGQGDVQGGGHADRGEVGGAVGAAPDVVERGQVENTPQVGDAAGVHHG